MLSGPLAWAQGQKVLKFVPQADLRILDPITTTAYITRNHGYMIYDTLFATDAKFQVQPQMVDKYELSSDKLTYTFTLRDGLKFVKEEWVPGSKVVYVKNTDYVPRKEAPSWAAGGKVVKVDRVEWIYIPDSATAAAAINAGEVDWWEQMPPDLIPVLAKNKNIKVENIDPLGSMGLLRFNFMYPPFNNQKMRQAILYAIDQNDYV